MKREKSHRMKIHFPFMSSSVFRRIGLHQLPGKKSSEDKYIKKSEKHFELLRAKRSLKMK